MTVVDVGANVGSYAARFVARVGPSGRVYAIEPSAAVLPHLSANVPAAVIIHAALGDHDGLATLYHSEESLHHSLYPANLVKDTGTSEPVRLATLDGLVRSQELPPAINVVKIDAQGAEMAILRGAKHLLGARHALWYLELWPQGLNAAGSSADDVCRHLERLNYHPVGSTWSAVRNQAGAETGHGSLDILVRAAA